MYKRQDSEGGTVASVASDVADSAASPLAGPAGEVENELRVLDWTELTARLNAARDFRRVLLREANRQSDGFADAAARYFRTKDNPKQGVNLVALEQSKGSSCIESQRKLGPAAKATQEIKND